MSIELNQDNFEKMLSQNGVLVIDFGAQWCAPCQSFAKVLEVAEQEYPAVVFAVVDIEKQTALAEYFEIRSVPALMILRDEVLIYAESGALTLSNLKELIDQAIALAPEQLEEGR